MSRCLSLIIALLFSFFSTPLLAVTIHVPGDSTTIQGGINGAVNGDTVMVAQGTYYEYDVDFLGKAITVMGTDPEDSAVVAATVVDGDSLGIVFYFHSGEGSESVLAGLTISGGSGDYGGGIYCYTASPRIVKNIVRDNHVVWHGGGIACYDAANAEITNNLVMLNSSRRGGGISIDASDAIVTNNIIRENHARTVGGGFIARESGSPIILNNIFTENYAGSGGGGVRTYACTPTYANNLIINNTGEYFGGGISTHVGSGSLFINNTVTGNIVPSGNGGAIYATDNPTIINCILWDNQPDEIYGVSDVTYSDVEGGWSGDGNIDEDPQFIDAGNGDYHLQSESPCIDAGDPTIFDECIPPGLGEIRSDMGAYGGEQNCGWESRPFSVYLYMWPDGPVDVAPEDVLEFNTQIWNYSENTVEGDYWLSVMLPNSTEFLIPEPILNYDNPMSGRIFPLGRINLSNQLFIPAVADTGSYSLIGRVGRYPDTIIDEESFGFRVVE
jgi:hypothetical protein